MPVTKRSILDQVEDILLTPAKLTISNRPIKILMVGPEVAPYATVGGLSQVMTHLSRALVKLGHDVRVFMPKFGLIDEEEYPMEMIQEGLKVPTGDEKNPHLICNVKCHQAAGHAPVYFLENREYYELRANVYGYQDDHIRWALLSRGVLEFMRQHNWVPDIIHCNDWQTGHIPNWLKTAYEKEGQLERVTTIFTIHNLQFQGQFDHRNITELQFDDGRSEIAPFFDERLLFQNFMRRGIMYADIVSTVSKHYAHEILKPEYGEGLDRLLTEVRAKLFGVLNGIDFEEMNPATDRLIVGNYASATLQKRAANKKALQEEFDLVVDRDVPLLGFVGRMDQQKGVDLIVEVMQPLMRDFEVQFVAVGGGDGGIMESLRRLQEEFPAKVGVHLMPDFTLPRLVFAGSDMMLVPSRFEPGGIVPLEGMRYGAVPIVRATGGLADSVKNFDPGTGEGWGFVFKDFDAWAFFAQIVRALETYRQKNIWQRIQQAAMQQDNSWAAQAGEYLDLYQRAIHVRTNELIDEGKLEREIG